MKSQTYSELIMKASHRPSLMKRFFNFFLCDHALQVYPIPHPTQPCPFAAGRERERKKKNPKHLTGFFYQPFFPPLFTAGCTKADLDPQGQKSQKWQHSDSGSL